MVFLSLVQGVNFYNNSLVDHKFAGFQSCNFVIFGQQVNFFTSREHEAFGRGVTWSSRCKVSIH